jgi:hypothetical protein
MWAPRYTLNGSENFGDLKKGVPKKHPEKFHQFLHLFISGGKENGRDTYTTTSNHITVRNKTMHQHANTRHLLGVLGWRVSSSRGNKSKGATRYKTGTRKNQRKEEESQKD